MVKDCSDLLPGLYLNFFLSVPSLLILGGGGPLSALPPVVGRGVVFVPVMLVVFESEDFLINILVLRRF